MKLRELQELFSAAILAPGSTAEAAIANQITAAQSLSPMQGLAIYQSGVRGTLRETLASIYPVCLRLVGEDFFGGMAIAYIKQYPANSPDLADYGDYFADFITDFAPAASLPYLVDVARLEWHWHRVFHGENALILDYQALSQVAPEQWGKLKFYLPKNSILQQSPYPVHRIWQVNQPNYLGKERVSLEEGACRFLIWQKNYEMRIDLLSDEEWIVLLALTTSQPLELICEQLSQTTPAIDVGSLLPKLVQKGWIARFEAPE